MPPPRPFLLMTTIYELLGITPEEANDPGELKRAYRKASLAAHPDRKGGDSETMAGVVEAYEILSNPDKRAVYDRTGSTSAAHSHRKDLEEALANIFLQSLQGNPSNPMEGVRTHIHMGRTASEGAVRKAENSVRVIEKAILRLRYKGKGGSHLHESLNLRVSVIKGEIESLNNQIQFLSLLADEARAYEFETDPDDPPRTDFIKLMTTMDGHPFKQWTV